MARLKTGGLTDKETQLLRMVRRGAQGTYDQDHPYLVIFEHPDFKTFRTREFMVRRLQNRRLIVQGTSMTRLELTQEGMERLEGNWLDGWVCVGKRHVAAVVAFRPTRFRGVEEPGGGSR